MKNYFILKLNFQKQLLHLFFLILSFVTNAQNKQPKFFAQAAIGPSFPIGQFSNKNYTGSFLSNTDGLAKTGIGINLSLGYQLKKSFGTMLLFGFSQNKQDASSFDVYLKNTYGSNITTSIKTNNWSVFKVMAGGFFVAPFSPENKFSFRAKLLAGVCKTGIPKFEYVYVNPQTTNSGQLIFAKVSLPWTFCYQLNAGLQYQLSQKIYLLFDAAYFSGNPIYKYSYNPNFPEPGILVQAEKKIILSSIQLMAGAGINF